MASDSLIGQSNAALSPRFTHHSDVGSEKALRHLSEESDEGGEIELVAEGPSSAVWDPYFNTSEESHGYQSASGSKMQASHPPDSSRHFAPQDVFDDACLADCVPHGSSYGSLSLSQALLHRGARTARPPQGNVSHTSSLSRSSPSRQTPPQQSVFAVNQQSPLHASGGMPSGPFVRTGYPSHVIPSAYSNQPTSWSSEHFGASTNAASSAFPPASAYLVKPSGSDTELAPQQDEVSHYPEACVAPLGDPSKIRVASEFHVSRYTPQSTPVALS